MNRQESSEEKIARLEERIKYLEEVNRLNVNALEQAAHLGDFHAGGKQLNSRSSILEETRSRISSLIPFSADAFYLVNESNSEFYLENNRPAEDSQFFRNEINHLIENGTFAWVVREERPIFLPTSNQSQKMLLHVLTTSARIRGLFVGILPHGEKDVPLVALSLLSIILRYSANALESYELYNLIRRINASLEERVASRTRKLEFQLKLENMLAHILTTFVDVPQDKTCQTIIQTLQTITDFIGAETYFLIFFHENHDLNLCLQDFEPNLLSRSPAKTHLTDLNHYRFISRKIQTLSPLRLPVLDSLPEEAEREKTFFKNLGVKSALVIPMELGGAPVGFFGFGFKDPDDPRSSDISGILKIVGEIFIIALKRVKAGLALKVSRDQLRQAQKMDALGRLAGGVAHDFNNILTAITISAEIAQQSPDIDDASFNKFNEILRSCQRASNLTRQLLTVSRRQIIQPELLDVGYLISDLNRMLRRLIPEDIDIVVTVPTPPAFVKADLGQIEQVLINLAVNARDAIYESRRPDSEGRIVISVSHVFFPPHHDNISRGIIPHEGDYVCIRVSDSGIGMDSETCSRIFEPFFTTKNESKGTGLGLATVYGIVKQNKGGIIVESVPGSGSTFDIFWPSAEMTETQPESSITLKPAPGGNETVLLVEDDVDIRLAVEDLLDMKGYKVLAADNGRHALERLERFEGKVDILVTDIMMPEMGGRKLAEILKQRTPDLKIIYTTGYANDQIDLSESLPPDSKLIQKPYSLSTITQLIRKMLDQ